MAVKNQVLFDKIKACIDNFFDLNGYSPSVRDISVVIGTPKSTVQRYLDAMRKSGIIKNGKYGIETEHISKTERAVVCVPVLGFIPCGPLTEEEEYVDSYIKLPRSFLGAGDFFILTAHGNSMVEAGIDDGDLVVVKRQNYASGGDIIVALADGKNTLKRYFPEPQNKRIRLHPENAEMEDFYVTELYIQGVATKVIKDL
ncbi:MAG: repressor LexA [Clostridia bacterium]|nr:repressor LexA [Clostridia bacterium]